MFTTMDGVNIGSICKVAILFSNIAHDLLHGKIQVETLQMIQNRIGHTIHLLQLNSFHKASMKGLF